MSKDTSDEYIETNPEAIDKNIEVLLLENLIKLELLMTFTKVNKSNAEEIA